MTLDNFELSTIHYTLFYYLDNANLDEDEIKKAFPDRVTDDEHIFIFDRDLTPNEITLKVEWIK